MAINRKCYSCKKNKPCQKCSCGNIVCETCSRVGGHNRWVGHMGYEAHATFHPTKRKLNLLSMPRCCDAFILMGIHHIACYKNT